MPFDRWGDGWRKLAVTFLLCAIEDYARAVRAGLIDRGAVRAVGFTRRGMALKGCRSKNEFRFSWQFKELCWFMRRAFPTWWALTVPKVDGEAAQKVVLSWTRKTVPRQRFWRAGEEDGNGNPIFAGETETAPNCGEWTPEG